jgi:hypothetical protein
MKPVLGWTMLSWDEMRQLERALSGGEQDTRDEIGFLLIHQGFADCFFPGTSVLRIGYALFIPWLYRRAAYNLRGVRLISSGLTLQLAPGTDRRHYLAPAHCAAVALFGTGRKTAIRRRHSFSSFSDASATPLSSSAGAGGGSASRSIMLLSLEPKSCFRQIGSQQNVCSLGFSETLVHRPDAPGA